MIRERKLIKKIKEKADKSAANELITMYYAEVYIYVFKQTEDKEMAMDLTQEIFISMLKSIRSYEENKASFKTWLYKICGNKIVDYYRSKYYKYSTIVEDIENFNLYDSNNIELNLELKEDTRKVLDIVNKFDSNTQQIFRLKFFGEMTFIEIAKVLEISESTVKTRYYSAIRKIKKILEGGENGQK